MPDGVIDPLGSGDVDQPPRFRFSPTVLATHVYRSITAVSSCGLRLSPPVAVFHRAHC
jgi:hypothetical protein